MISNPVRDLGWRTDRDSIPIDLPNRVNTDSRRIEPNQWFVPIKGAQFDGHDFINAALAQGAAGFIYSKSSRDHLSAEQRQLGIEVDDTTQALQDLAGWWRCRLNCSVVGITGSSGKTTVKEMTAVMLQSIGPTLKTEGSLNNELGVPLTLCRLTPSHQFAVIEMGARHKGDISFLTKIALPDVGVLLNVGSAHAGEFGGVDKILEAKMEIAAAPGFVYLADDPRIVQAAHQQTGKKLVSFGLDPQSDLRLLEKSFNGQGQIALRFTVHGQELLVQSDFYHSSYPINVAACLAVGIALGQDPALCATGIQSFRGIKGRFKVHRIKDQLLIDDSYNANPESMKAGLETLQEAYQNRKICLILGDMLELGDSSEAAHRSIGALCASRIRPERLITVGPMAHWISDEAIKTGLAPSRVQHFASVDQVLLQLPMLWPWAELLYVKASNGLRLSKIVDTLLSP